MDIIKILNTNRYIIFNPIRDFFENNPTGSLQKEDGYKNRKWFTDKISELTNLGYTESYDATGGDHDYLVIDSKRKEWCWWENGFYPFCSDEIPTNKNLEYWATHRN